MGDVVGFQPKVVLPAEEDGPHISGEAACGACGHCWTAVAPAGTTILECPKCARMWGAYKHCVEPDAAWRCNCGEQLFWLTPTGAMCRRCGTRSNQWAE